MVHIKLHSSTSSNSCKYCQQPFENSDDLENHVKEKHKDKLYHCPYGDFVSESHSSILLHFEMKGHSPCHKFNPNSVKEIVYENKSYGQDSLFGGKSSSECPICFESFESPSSYQIHTKIHSGNSKFECKFCLDGFQTIEEQQIHVKEKHLKPLF